MMSCNGGVGRGMLIIRNLEPEDLPVIAKLHIDHMPLTFPPCRLYLNLMKLVYSTFLFDQEGICGVATMDDDVVGFVCFHKCPKRIYTTALKNYTARFCGNVMMLLLRFPVFLLKGVPRVVGTLRSSASAEQPTVPASDLWKDSYELRPMVVRKDKQGTSVAGQLVSWGEKMLMMRGEKQYFLHVRQDNPRAIAFYNKMGLTKAAIENIRIVMVKDLK
jgi:ribosomal protein S18 acetylase RimI-like enzyme